LATADGWEGLFTHFHSADTDPGSARTQWERLQATVAALGRRPRWLHAASSAGCFAGAFGGDLARPGIYLYGGRAGVHCGEPVARFQARVIAVRRIGPGQTVSYGATWSPPGPTTIATIAAGYADGLPRALGAAIACPTRKVVALQADGSAMYTLQALWSMAREQADVTVVILNNRSYAILNIELARVGAGQPTPKTLSLLDLSRPDLDFVALAASMGVPATRATNAEEFDTQLAEAVAARGPRLIEAMVVQQMPRSQP
jgi:hypothetical protein